MKTRLRTPSSIVALVLLILALSASIQGAGPPQPQTPPELAGCAVFPADNVWNVPVDTLPVDANSAAYVATIGADRYVHADFGSGTWEGGPIGIPYLDVPGTQPMVSGSECLAMKRSS